MDKKILAAKENKNIITSREGETARKLSNLRLQKCRRIYSSGVLSH